MKKLLALTAAATVALTAFGLEQAADKKGCADACSKTAVEKASCCNTDKSCAKDAACKTADRATCAEKQSCCKADKSCPEGAACKTAATSCSKKEACAEKTACGETKAVEKTKCSGGTCPIPKS